MAEMETNKNVRAFYRLRDMYGDCEIKIICKNSEKDVRFCDCQYRVYEEINIQNTGGTDYAEQMLIVK